MFERRRAGRKDVKGSPSGETRRHTRWPMLPAVQLKARPLKPCYWIKLAWLGRVTGKYDSSTTPYRTERQSKRERERGGLVACDNLSIDD